MEKCHKGRSWADASVSLKAWSRLLWIASVWCKCELKSVVKIVVECSCAGCPADERLLLGVISYPRQRTRDYRPDTVQCTNMIYHICTKCDVIVKQT